MIKCRVRDLKTKKIVAYEWVATDDDNHGSDCGDSGWRHKRLADASQRVYLGAYWPIGIREQFTGLTDEKGVEIYEGDIVKAPDLDSKPPDYEFTGIVKYDRGSFVLAGGKEKMTIWIPYWTQDQCCIIGSIHDKQEDKE